MVLFAGHDQTTNGIGTGLVSLLEPHKRPTSML